MVRQEWDRTFDNQNRSWIQDKNDTRNILRKMMKIGTILSFVAIVLTSCIQEAIFTDERNVDLKVNDDKDEVEFSHHAILDKNGKYHLYWLPATKAITFEVQVGFYSILNWMLYCDFYVTVKKPA